MNWVCGALFLPREDGGAAMGKGANATGASATVHSPEPRVDKERFIKQGRRVPADWEAALAQFLGLRYYEDLRTLCFCAFYFTLIYIQLHCEFTYRYQTIGLFWLTSLSAFQGAVSVHNAVHCPVFQEHWKNRLFQCVLSVWFGHCASSYVPGHNLSHHRNLQTTKDVMRTTKMKFRWNLLNGLLFMPSILISTSENDANYFAAQKALRRPIFYQLRLEAVVYVAFNLFVAYYNPQKWLWVVWLPCLMGKYMIISLNMLQHDGCDPNSKYNNSRNFTGEILNYLYFMNGYHGSHHLRPGKHWSLLKHDHDTKVKPFSHPNLDHESIFAYIFTQFVYPGVRVDFRGDPIPVVDDGPDEPWFYATTESYSDRDADVRAWSDNLSTFGPNGEPMAQLASRSAPSYTCMKDD